ncbi:hypothetical protein [Sphingobacterium suaedae]|uniref:Uncharacterized protein n=1 Tax=Sphingobacterium suaedae TaxID=1686402 RepID=A0ABW5KE81_9SPHI
MIRPLLKYDTGTLAGCHEFNRLRIKNLEQFFERYPHNVDCYASVFKILFDLEMEVKYLHQPEQSISVPYAEGLYAVFDLSTIQDIQGTRVAEYTFIRLTE